MKISEVTEITSLTKKAINYYEENGLISPSVNKENNYRDYTREDIEKLKQISVLRNFDIPVKKIREILVNPKEMEKIFTEHLNKIKAQILNMERSKDIFQLCINDINFPNSDIGKVTDDMMLLKRSLSMSEREKEVLKLLSEGLTRDEIAAGLYVSTGTVKTHLQNIYHKLEVKGKIAAIKKAEKLKLF